MNEDRGTMRGRIRVEGLRSLLIAVAIIHNSSFLIHNSACADTFKCGAEAVNALAAATDAAEAAVPTNALEKLLAEIKADDFENDKAREVALGKAKEILAKADYRLPDDTRDPSVVLSVLADDAGLPEAAYAVVLQKENAKLFAARGGIRDWLYGTAAGIQKGYDGSWDDIELAPIPDRRLAFVEATKDVPKGVVKSVWKYENGTCNWTFTIPAGAKATVCVNGMCARYEAGEHTLEIKER